MEKETKNLIKIVSDMDEKTKAADNIRENGSCRARHTTENIDIVSKTDKPGIDIKVKPNTKGETVYIPALVTHENVKDLVYNDFFIGDIAC